MYICTYIYYTLFFSSLSLSLSSQGEYYTCANNFADCGFVPLVEVDQFKLEMGNFPVSPGSSASIMGRLKFTIRNDTASPGIEIEIDATDNTAGQIAVGFYGLDGVVSPMSRVSGGGHRHECRAGFSCDA